MIFRIQDKLRQRYREFRKKRFTRDIERILSSACPTDTATSEAAYAQLQANYPSDRGDGYRYDDVSLFERASARASRLLRFAEMESPGKRILDIGAGDSVLGSLLMHYGHDVVATDLEDWRSRLGKSVPFQQADIMQGCPFGDSEFDLVVSYNSFEHFPDPKTAFAEALRVTKPGGYLYFEFCPLYASPWGLHAYRSLYMPYAQYLFSEAFIIEKLKELGIIDLGKERSELQFLNKWKPSYFKDLWQHQNVTLEFCEWSKEYGHLDLVRRFPKAFQGRSLTIEDLTTSGNQVLLRKRFADQ